MDLAAHQVKTQIIDPQRRESLGAAERTIGTLLAYTDHLVHNRPGALFPDDRFACGTRWEAIKITPEGEPAREVVYVVKKGHEPQKLGFLNRVRAIIENEQGGAIAAFREAGMYPEVGVHLYRQVSDIWQLDNEFAARWASYAYKQENRDIKVVLAAFMLVQSRKGERIEEGDGTHWDDEDYRAVGEAMMLIRTQDGKDLNPKLLLRIRELLELPSVVAINRRLGFGASSRRAFLGRWPKTVEAWLQHRERNRPLLDGLVRAGYRTTVMHLARAVGYKPETDYFFEALRWKQKQARDGRRTIRIGAEVAAAEFWAGLDERAICEKIVASRPNWKKIVRLVPREVGLTRAIVAATIESGCLSDADLVILTPTLEELGLLEVVGIKNRWSEALARAENLRAANVAKRVKREDTKKEMEESAEKIVQKAVEEVSRDLDISVFVDMSGSMKMSGPAAKELLNRFLHAFPLERLHICCFNSMGREVTLKAATAKAVEHAFAGFSPSGGTDHAAAVLALAKYRPGPEQDALHIFVGDGGEAHGFAHVYNALAYKPVAFGFLELPGQNYGAIDQTASELGIPVLRLDPAAFDDVYAVPRILRTMIASAPVNLVDQMQRSTPRRTLVDTILSTPLLVKPTWAR